MIPYIPYITKKQNKELPFYGVNERLPHLLLFLLGLQQSVTLVLPSIPQLTHHQCSCHGWWSRYPPSSSRRSCGCQPRYRGSALPRLCLSYLVWYRYMYPGQPCQNLENQLLLWNWFDLCYCEPVVLFRRQCANRIGYFFCLCQRRSLLVVSSSKFLFPHSPHGMN